MVGFMCCSEIPGRDRRSSRVELQKNIYEIRDVDPRQGKRELVKRSFYRRPSDTHRHQLFV